MLVLMQVGRLPNRKDVRKSAVHEMCIWAAQVRIWGAEVRWWQVGGLPNRKLRRQSPVSRWSHQRRLWVTYLCIWVTQVCISRDGRHPIYKDVRRSVVSPSSVGSNTCNLYLKYKIQIQHLKCIWNTRYKYSTWNVFEIQNTFNDVFKIQNTKIHRSFAHSLSSRDIINNPCRSEFLPPPPPPPPPPRFQSPWLWIFMCDQHGKKWNK